MPSAGSLCDQYKQPYESMYSTMVGMVLLQTETLCKLFTPYDPSLNLAGDSLRVDFKPSIQNSLATLEPC